MEKNNIKENTIIKKVSLVGIIGNIILSGFKLFAGIVGNSHAMISDALHSASDILATFIAFLGVRLSKKAPDQDHPYGHERIECIASLSLGAILAITGFEIGKIGVKSIVLKSYETLSSPTMISLVAAIVSIVTKEIMFWYTRHYAKLLNSAAFLADAWHHRSDAFSSIGSLIGISGAMLGYPVFDFLASIVICAFILKTALSIIKDSISKLLDTSSGSKFENTLKSYVDKQEDVIKVDVLHTRMFGNKVYVDLEIELDGNMSLRDSHAIAEKIHNSMERDFPNIKHVMIHVNPACK